MSEFFGLNGIGGVTNTYEATVANDVDLSEDSLQGSKQPLKLTSTALAGKIQGLHRNLAVAGGKLYERFVEVSGGVQFVTDSPVSFATVNERTFIVDGLDAKVWDGGFRQMGIVQPLAIPATVAVGSGNVGLDSTSNFTYFYTFYDASTDRESAISPVSTSLSLDGKSVSITNIEVSTNADVTHKRIYRLGGAFSTNYVLVDTIDNATTNYTDNIADSALLDAIQITSIHNFPPPPMTQIIEFKGYLVGISSDRVNLNISRPYPNMEAFPLENYILQGATDNRIMGIIEFHDAVIVFREDDVEVMYGNSPTDFYFKQIYGAVGCVASRSITKTEQDTVLYLSNVGIKEITDQSSKDVKILELAPEFVNENKYGFYTESATNGFYTEPSTNGFYTEPRLGGEIGIVWNDSYYLTDRRGKLLTLTGRTEDKGLKPSFETISGISAFFNDGQRLLYGNTTGDVYELGGDSRYSSFTYETLQTDFKDAKNLKRINKLWLEFQTAYDVAGTDDFSSITQQNLLTGGDGVKGFSWNLINSSNVNLFSDVNITTTGVLSMDSPAVAVESNTGLTASAYKVFTGDFDIDIKMTANPLDVNRTFSFTARSVADRTNFVETKTVLNADTVNVGITVSRYVAGVQNFTTSTAVAGLYHRITRTGTNFAHYWKANAGDAWTLKASIGTSSSIGTNDVQVGLELNGSVTGINTLSVDYFNVTFGTIVANAPLKVEIISNGVVTATKYFGSTSRVRDYIWGNVASRGTRFQVRFTGNAGSESKVFDFGYEPIEIKGRITG